MDNLVTATAYNEHCLLDEWTTFILNPPENEPNQDDWHTVGNERYEYDYSDDEDEQENEHLKPNTSTWSTTVSLPSEFGGNKSILIQLTDNGTMIKFTALSIFNTLSQHSTVDVGKPCPGFALASEHSFLPSFATSLALGNSPEHSTLILLALSNNGYYYRISVPIAKIINPNVETRAVKLEYETHLSPSFVRFNDGRRLKPSRAVGGVYRKPKSLHIASIHQLVVLCQDGWTILVKFTNNGVIEIPLYPPSKSIFSLFKGPPSSTVAIATTPHIPDFCFALSREGGIRVYDLVREYCVKEQIEHLEKDHSNAQEIDLGSGSIKIFPQPPTNQDSLKLLLVVHIPRSAHSVNGSFLFFDIATTRGQNGTFSPSNLIPRSSVLAPGEEHNLSDWSQGILLQTEGASLIDFSLEWTIPDAWKERMSNQVRPKRARLWTLWDGKGASTVVYYDVPSLSLLPTDPEPDTSKMDETLVITLDGEFSLPQIIFTQQWRTLHPGPFAEEYGVLYLDKILSPDMTEQTVVETYVNCLFYPGRFTQSTLEWALEMYEEGIIDSVNERFSEATNPLLKEYSSLREKAIHTVGCFIETEPDEYSGVPMEMVRVSNIRREWNSFTALVVSGRTEQTQAIALGQLGVNVSETLEMQNVDQQDNCGGGIVVLYRDAVGLPMNQSNLQVLVAAKGEAVDPRELLDLDNTADENAANLAQDLSSLVYILEQLQERLELNPVMNQMFTSEVLRILTTVRDTIIDEVVRDIWEVLNDVDDDQTEGGHLISPACQQLLGDLQEELAALNLPGTCFVRLWHILSVEEALNPNVSGVKLDDAIRPSLLLVPSTFSTNLLASYADHDLEGRDTLLRMYFLLLILERNANMNIIPEWDSLVEGTLASLHCASRVSWILRQIGGTPKGALVFEETTARSGGSDVIALLNDLDINTKTSQSEQSESSFSLMVSLLTNPTYTPAFSNNVSILSSGSALGGLFHLFLSNLGIYRFKRFVIDSPDDVILGQQLLLMKLPALAWEWSLWFAIGGPGLRYIKGVAAMKLGKLGDAGREFTKAATGFYSDDDGARGLYSVIPTSRCRTLSDYYEFISNIFSTATPPKDFSSQKEAQFIKACRKLIILFSSQAIQHFEGPSDSLNLLGLWMNRFRAQVMNHNWDEAYMLLSNSPEYVLRDAMGYFVGEVCEAEKMELFKQYSFAGMENVLEESIEFRTRNAATLESTISYTKLLYGFYVNRQNYRQAASIMFELGLYLASVGQSSELLMVQRESFMIALQCLDLVLPESAWFSVDVKTSDLPYLVLQTADNSDLRPRLEADLDRQTVLVDADVLKKYQLIASFRLDLGVDLPELIHNSFSLSPSDIIGMYTERGMYERAIEVAFSFKIEVSDLITSMTQQCIQLSQKKDISHRDVEWLTESKITKTWSGDIVSKAWKFLQYIVTKLQHIDKERVRGYFELILVEILKYTNPDSDRVGVPDWVIVYFKEQDLAALVRQYYCYGRIREALETAISLVKTSKIQPLPASSNLPYGLFDELLNVSFTTLSTEEKKNITEDVLKKQQDALRSLLTERISELERVQKLMQKKARS